MTAPAPPVPAPGRRPGTWHGAPVWVWVVGGSVVAGLGYIWWRNRHAAAATPAAPTAGTAADSGQQTVPAYYPGAGYGLDASQYQQLLNGIGKLNGPLSGPAGPAGPAGPPGPAGGPATNTDWYLQQWGQEGGPQLSLRQEAARYAAQPGNPNSVEEELRQIVRLNSFAGPGHVNFSGRSTVPGGTPARIPKKRY